MNQAYHYLGNLRLQLWFDSPNHCAAFLVMTIMLSVGILLFFVSKDNKPHKVFWALMFCVIFGQEALLALTYSRGGYIALLAALPLMWLFCRRKRLLVFNLVFLSILLVTANGIDRVQSVVATGDGSIKHRLLLWEGGLSIIWNNPVAGVGPASVGKIYTAWYQPLWLNEAYKTLVNDYLTIAAAYGIFALLAYLALVLAGLWMGFRLWRDTKNPILLSVLGAIIAYLTAAIFTTFYCQWKVYWLFCLLFFVLAATIAHAIRRCQLKISFRDFLIPCGCAVSMCAVMLLVGFIHERGVPYNFKTSVCKVGKTQLDLTKAFPKTSVNALVLVLYSSETSSDVEAMRLLGRPLLDKGYAVVSAGVDSGMEGLACAEYALKVASEEAKRNGSQLLVVGQGDGGKHAMLVASKPSCPPLKAVVAIGSPASWPFDELSPEAQIKGLKAPLLLIHDRQDKNFPQSESESLKRKCDELKIPSELVIIEGSIVKKGETIDLIDGFASKKSH